MNMNTKLIVALVVAAVAGLCSDVVAGCRPCRRKRCENVVYSCPAVRKKEPARVYSCPKKMEQTYTECGPAPICKKDISFTACAPAIRKRHVVDTFECPPGFEEESAE